MYLQTYNPGALEPRGLASRRNTLALYTKVEKGARKRWGYTLPGGQENNIHGGSCCLNETHGPGAPEQLGAPFRIVTCGYENMQPNKTTWFDNMHIRTF